ncbi:uridine phosphorylase-like [Schistocerca gregaria]|uniref:uridine phosphorylase-like n=1 Tax=Schistocerca gregaria TaxID=7010 RepID=UPI00211EE56F|nr:uridine phosphorylase-like [Schistocerca gregaria]
MKLKRSLIAARAIVVGDPERARYISTLLDAPITVSEVREYYTYTGTYKNIPVTVSSHGVGGSGASVAFEELIAAGVKVIIRAGTCGSFQPEFREASIIIATGAIRSDGVTPALIPISYPAVADYSVVQALKKACSDNPNIKCGIGVIATEGKLYDGFLGNDNELWSRAGVLAVEMECSVLFVIGSLRKIKTGAILNVDNYVLDRMKKGGAYDPHRNIVKTGSIIMCQVALEALISVPI